MQWSKANKFKRFTAILTASALFFTGIYFTPAAQAAGQQAEQTNLALNKTVYYSSEEGLSTSGADTHAVKAVDGDKTTCWSANGKPDGSNWDAQYPEWLCVDLGKTYNLNQINLIFEGKKSSHQTRRITRAQEMPLLSRQPVAETLATHRKLTANGCLAAKA